MMLTEGNWKKGDRVVVSNEPEHGAGTIDGDALIVAAGTHEVRFWPVLFDDLSEKMVEEKTLAPAPAESMPPQRYHVGEVVRTADAVSGTIVAIKEEDGRTRYKIEAWIVEDQLGKAEPTTKH
jgi:hypothetical protein